MATESKTTHVTIETFDGDYQVADIAAASASPQQRLAFVAAFRSVIASGSDKAPAVAVSATAAAGGERKPKHKLTTATTDGLEYCTHLTAASQSGLRELLTSYVSDDPTRLVFAYFADSEVRTLRVSPSVATGSFAFPPICAGWGALATTDEWKIPSQSAETVRVFQLGKLGQAITVLYSFADGATYQCVWTPLVPSASVARFHFNSFLVTRIPLVLSSTIEDGSTLTVSVNGIATARGPGHKTYYFHESADGTTYRQNSLCHCDTFDAQSAKTCKTAVYHLLIHEKLATTPRLCCEGGVPAKCDHGWLLLKHAWEQGQHVRIPVTELSRIEKIAQAELDAENDQNAAAKRRKVEVSSPVRSVCAALVEL